MKISIFTQNEDYFLKDNFVHFFENLPKKVIVSSVILCSASPFGEKLNLFQKFFRTLKIFGIKFTLRYSIKYLIRRFFYKNLRNILKENKIKTFVIDNKFSSTSIEYLKSSNLDLIVSISCPIILNSNILKIPTLGCINIHCSLLPKYRGLMPSFWTLLYGEKYSGISIFLMNDKIDDGPIIYQKKIKIDKLTLEDLILKTKKLSFLALNQVLKNFLKNEIKVINNNNKKYGSYFSFPNRGDIILFKKNHKFY